MTADRTINAIGTLATLAITAIAVSVTSPAAAAGTDLYIEYGGGASFVRNQNATGADASGAGLNASLESNVGFNFEAGIGTRIREMFRAELQFSYRQNEVTNFSLQGERPKATGHIGLLAVMANGYVDYDLGIGVIPYVGVGIGWGRMEIDSKNRGGPFQASIEGQDSVFAWNVMIGGSYPVNEIIDLSLGYRYIATTDPEIDSSITELGVFPSNQFARRLDSEFDAHELVMALRFNF